MHTNMKKNMVSVAFSLVKQEKLFFIKWLAVSKLVFYLNYCLYYVYNMTYMYSKSNFDFPFLPGWWFESTQANWHHNDYVILHSDVICDEKNPSCKDSPAAYCSKINVSVATHVCVYVCLCVCVCVWVCVCACVCVCVCESMSKSKV